MPGPLSWPGKSWHDQQVPVGLSGKSNLCNRISFSVCLSRPVGVAIKKNRWAGRGRGTEQNTSVASFPRLPFVSEFELPARAHTSLCVWAAHSLTGGKRKESERKARRVSPWDSKWEPRGTVLSHLVGESKSLSMGVGHSSTGLTTSCAGERQALLCSVS